MKWKEIKFNVMEWNQLEWYLIGIKWKELKWNKQNEFEWKWNSLGSKFHKGTDTLTNSVPTKQSIETQGQYKHDAQ